MHSLPPSIGINLLSTKSYVFSNSDSGKSVLLSGNSSLSAGLSANWTCNVKNINNTKISIIPLSGLIDGKTLINLYPNESCTLVSDGTNIFIFNRSRTVVMQSINIANNPATGNLDITGLNDTEITNIQFDFNIILNAPENLSTLISLNSSFITTGSLYNIFYVALAPGNYPQGSTGAANKFTNYSIASDANFMGTINLMGFGTNRLIYKSNVIASAYYTTIANGFFSNGSVITNFDGFRFSLNTVTNRFTSGLVNVTGYRN